jgi:hypothetical protein
MSIHLQLPEYKCKNCKTTFIAYSKGVECPKCKQKEESQGECYDFVSTQADIMLYHKEKYGRFFPDGWHIGSYCEHVQSTIFKVFDYIEQNPEAGWEEFLKQKMIDGDGNEFTNEEYVRNLFIAINEELYKERIDFKGFNKELHKDEKEKNGILNKIKKFFISKIR